MINKGISKNKIVIAISYAVLDLAIIFLSLYLGKLLGDDKSLFFDRWLFIFVNLCSFYLFSIIFRTYLFSPSTVTTSYLLKICIVFVLTTFVTLTFSILLTRYSLGDRWLVCYLLVFFILYTASRVFYRVYLHILHIFVEKTDKQYKRAIIVGAGVAATLFIREIGLSNKNKLVPVCLLDDDVNKQKTELLGVKVEGPIDNVDKFVKKYNAEIIVVCLPSASVLRKKEIYEQCVKTGLKVYTVKEICELGSSNKFTMNEIDVKDLLGREQITVDSDEIAQTIENKVVLVTGGSGSIGSELCRQIASKNPKLLVIFDIYENTTYALERELKKSYPDLKYITLIGSVRDKTKIEDVFKTYKPSVVFHAAAHKHVPLMETSPNEAVKNNVIGTYNTVRMADKYNVKKFVLISTDKAVNPTNVMGATKRICEMIVQSYAKKSKTNFVAVRFGNVLGSNGSVIPFFKQQIVEGGPLTVTHKDITRFFMTIPEAVSLVLQACVYAKGGEIFVLDMGTPVKILDLAENLIKLAGYRPYVDIDIVFTGLRPGEKLYEERLMDEEGMLKTDNELISIGKPIEFDDEKLYTYLDLLEESAYKEADDIKELVSQLVPTYTIDHH